MPAAILWATLIAWLLFVVVALIELLQHRRGQADPTATASELRTGPAAIGSRREAA